MMVPAEPVDLERLGIIPMMHLCRLSAQRARLTLDPAALQILVGIRAADVFLTRFWGERMGLSPFAHVGVGARSAVPSRPAITAAFLAKFHVQAVNVEQLKSKANIIQVNIM
jgi:hypothetical protein